MFKQERQIERRLRSFRPEARDELVSALAATTRPVLRHGMRPAARVAFTASVTTLLLVGLAAVGGAGYAKSVAVDASVAVKRALVPHTVKARVALTQLSAGSDQYKPGYGWGDKNHTHTGPPGLAKKGGEFAPPLQAKKAGKSSTVSTAFTIDEQAHLYVSVIDSQLNEILLTQGSGRGGSTVGSPLRGPPTKVIQYIVLVPRLIPLKLQFASKLLDPSKTYRIRVVARDPQGNRSVLLLPFRA